MRERERQRQTGRDRQTERGEKREREGVCKILVLCLRLVINVWSHQADPFKAALQARVMSSRLVKHGGVQLMQTLNMLNTPELINYLVILDTGSAKQTNVH